MSTEQLERFRCLPQRAEDTWQAALIRVPQLVQHDEGHPIRPWGGVCISKLTDTVGPVTMDSSGGRTPLLALESIVKHALSKYAGYRPGRVEFRQPEVAAELGPWLAEAGIEVAQQPALEALEHALADLRRTFLGAEANHGALCVAGVTIEHLRGFAEAAREFHESAAWERLCEYDLIEVAAPDAPEAQKYAIVTGATIHERGMWFFRSAEEFWRTLQPDDTGEQHDRGNKWIIVYCREHTLPYGDIVAWDEHELPVANERAYPFLARLARDEMLVRPSPQLWVYVEGLLRALARSSDDQLDSGRWSIAVATRHGPAEYALSLPLLLDPPPQPKDEYPDRRVIERMMMDIERATAGMEFSSKEEYLRYINENVRGKPVPRQPARTPLEQAQDLVFAAAEAFGRRRIKLLREALRICPDCADAFVMLAEQSNEVESAREWFLRGLAAAERTMDRETFDEHVGNFWGVLETRPYMRARFGLGQCCEATGELDHALAHYEELLRLSPQDNQGVRYRLAICLLKTRNVKRLEELLNGFDDATAYWKYLRALAAFAKSGDAPSSRAALAEARKANRHVSRYLLDGDLLPAEAPPMYRLGSDEEAAAVASDLIDIWRSTRGATSWLRREAGGGGKGKKKR